MKIIFGKVQRTISWNFIKKIINNTGSKILLMLDIAGWIASLFPDFHLSSLFVLWSNIIILVVIVIWILIKKEYKVLEKPKAVLLEHTYYINALTISPDEKQLASCGGDNYAILWEKVSEKVLRRIPHDGWVGNVAFSPDGRFLFSVTGKNGLFKAWEVETGSLVKEYPHPKNAVSRGLAVEPSGKRVFICSKDGSFNSFDPLDIHFYSMPVQITDVELRRICISNKGLIAAANIKGEIFLLKKDYATYFL